MRETAADGSKRGKQRGDAKHSQLPCSLCGSRSRTALQVTFGSVPQRFDPVSNCFSGYGKYKSRNLADGCTFTISCYGRSTTAESRCKRSTRNSQQDDVISHTHSSRQDQTIFPIRIITSLCSTLDAMKVTTARRAFAMRLFELLTSA